MIAKTKIISVDFGGWSMDISVTLMMTVPKVSAMAWCYEDGKRSADKLSAGLNHKIV